MVCHAIKMVDDGRLTEGTGATMLLLLLLMMRSDVLKGLDDCLQGIDTSPIRIKNRVCNTSIATNEWEASVVLNLISGDLRSTMGIETGYLEREV